MSTLFLPGWIEALIWFLIAVIFIAVEAFTPSFFLIWFGIGSFVAAILALIGINEVIQIVIFILISMITMAFARPLVKNFIYKGKGPEKSNIYSIIGTKAIVLKEVTELKGKVKVLSTGETWSAYTREHFQPIKEDVQVVVEEVDGAKLVVIPKSAHEAMSKNNSDEG